MPRLTKPAVEQYKRERAESQLLLEQISSGFRVQRDGIDVIGNAVRVMRIATGEETDLWAG
jgi:hypothetical protein